jgi:hypothetical protein
MNFALNRLTTVLAFVFVFSSQAYANPEPLTKEQVERVVAKLEKSMSGKFQEWYDARTGGRCEVNFSSAVSLTLFKMELIDWIPGIKPKMAERPDYQNSATFYLSLMPYSYSHRRGGGEINNYNNAYRDFNGQPALIFVSHYDTRNGAASSDKTENLFLYLTADESQVTRVIYTESKTSIGLVDSSPSIIRENILGNRVANTKTVDCVLR